VLCPNADIVLFGGFGDLARRKLWPALFNLFANGELQAGTRVLLLGRDRVERAELGERMADVIRPVAETAWQEHGAAFLERVVPVTLAIGAEQEDWSELGTRLGEQPNRIRVYYLALPPSLFQAACDGLGRHGLIDSESRLVIEKPIGHDRASAAEIVDGIAQHFGEHQVYRIDHYLGKEAVQNLLVLRYSNTLFETQWNNTSIDSVQITLAETVGLEGRVSFYDGTGALRDMVQNHLLQILALVCMSAPNRMDANSIRQEKIKVLNALRPIQASEVSTHTVRGQYRAGVSGGVPVQGYADELGRDSNTETFVALRAYVDNWRWDGVPFYLRTGKRLARRFGEVVVNFKPVPHDVYEGQAGPIRCNRLVIAMQPDESINMTIMVKTPGRGEVRVEPMTMELDLPEAHQLIGSGYQRLMLDVINADQSLFVHRDEVDAAWAWIDPIIAAWEAGGQTPLPYEAGSWGPREADFMLARDGHSWAPPFGTEELARR
jgi:glucose-6-phosphate 1-dehydrogenase